MRQRLLTHTLVAILVIPLAPLARATEPSPPQTPDATAKAGVIEAITAALAETYVFADVAAAMGERLAQRLADGAYDPIDSWRQLADQLTEDLQSVSHDRHLRVGPAPVRPEGETEPSDEELERQRATEMARDNYCFSKLERLPGNVGYLKLDCFAPAEYAGATAIAAMEFLANSDALVFDLRQNGGGSPSQIQLISSYLFDEPTHLNSFYIRKTDETKQFWTQAHVEGPRMSSVPVYVLTSRRTFSGAEEFAYNLKNLERATLVGETTGGGAHPVERVRLEPYPLAMALPYGRAVNPITGTNWEGTGVEPHLAVPAAQALVIAHLEAVKALEEKAISDEARDRLRWVRDGLQARRSPVSLEADQLAAYVGEYGPRRVTLEDGGLMYRRADGPPYHLVPMGDDRFILEELDVFRVQFERDETGRVVRIVGLYDQGERDSNDRTGP